MCIHAHMLAHLLVGMCTCTLTRLHSYMPTHSVISEPLMLPRVHSADEPELCGKFNVCSKVLQEPAGITLDRFFYERKRWLILVLPVVEVALWLWLAITNMQNTETR